MKKNSAKQMPDYARDRFHRKNNGRSPHESSYHNVRVYSQQRPHHNYLLPKKIIGKFNPASPKQQQHQQRYHHYLPPSNNPSKLKAAGISSSTCYVCNKSYPSSQFLYSHMMRMHPERGMQGVLPTPQQAPVMTSGGKKSVTSQPPRVPFSPMKSVEVPSRSASESSDVTAEPDCDTEKFVSSWGKKDRRGRTNNPCTICASNAAIASLQKPSETSCSIPSTSNTLIPNQQNPNISSSSTSTTANEISLIDDKMMKMTMTMSKKYKCNTCNKEFDTGQALGGHKSSSTCRAARETKLLAPAADHDHHAPQIVESTTKNKMADVVVSSTKKTMDDDDIEEGEIIEDGEVTDEEAGTQQMSRKVFDFDLNELPPEE